GSLEKFWHSFGSRLVPIETTIDLIKQVCRGLSLAHRENPPIIHRDIKPQNILVGYEADGLRARVSDFGLAKKVNPLTLLATGAGTPAFKPPEVFVAEKGDSCAGDVWAIGTTLYLLLTDRLPLAPPAGAAWDAPEFLDEPVPPPSEINPDANKALDHVVLKSLQKRPEDRYATATELLNALERWKPGATDSASASRILSSEPSKTVLGAQSPASERRAESLVERALDARKRGRLSEAADLMEEAFNMSQELRSKYSPQVKLWRCGISM
ncbi:MAG TPA: serine/threonine-protein kinase, partial [Thermoanaerobaculia bacterium]|nr:serine/threonine-protein kinase [Thermoanaerobaculia bacterium]